MTEELNPKGLVPALVTANDVKGEPFSLPKVILFSVLAFESVVSAPQVVDTVAEAIEDPKLKMGAVGAVEDPTLKMGAAAIEGTAEVELVMVAAAATVANAAVDVIVGVLAEETTSVKLLLKV